MRNNTMVKLGAVTLAFVLLGAGCYASNTGKNSSGTGTAVTIQDMSFSPNTLTVKAGTTVTWTNKDSVAHTVTGDNGGPASDLLASDTTYSYTFTTAGTV